MFFDMDGTFTRPVLRFSAYSRQMGVGDRPLLKYMATLPDDKQCWRKRSCIDTNGGGADSTLNPGLSRIARLVEERKIPTALITRNTVKKRGLRDGSARAAVRLLVMREDGKFKPHPAPLLLACEKLNVRPADAWMIGDASYDCIAVPRRACRQSGSATATLAISMLSRGKPCGICRNCWGSYDRRACLQKWRVGKQDRKIAAETQDKWRVRTACRLKLAGNYKTPVSTPGRARGTERPRAGSPRCICRATSRGRNPATSRRIQA